MTKYERFTNLEDVFNLRDRVKEKRGLLGDEKTKWTRQAHYPSSLRACKRQLVLDWLGESEEPPNFNSLITFGFGAAFENVIVKEFKDLDFYLGDEESFKLHDDRLEHPFSGRIDVLVKLDEEMDPKQLMRPVELKTMAGGQFEKTEYGGYGGRQPIVFEGGKTKPKSYHLDQLTVYLRKMNLDWGLLIYANKDNSDYCVYKVYYDQNRYDAIVDYCREIEELVLKARETGELPPGNMIEDDGSIVEITAPALTVGKRGELAGKPKMDKMNKSAGIVKFPCIWQNGTSGRIATCRFFEKCHGAHLEELGLTMEDLKEVKNE